MHKAIALSAVTAALLVTAACKNDRPAQSTTSTTSASVMNSDDAINQLTVRRCDHEIDCKNVGSGKHYDDRGSCEREMLHTLQVELGPTRCITGIREDRLTECMQTIRTADCGSSLDTTSGIATCRTSALCGSM
jgi:hypothetical protein